MFFLSLKKVEDSKKAKRRIIESFLVPILITTLSPAAVLYQLKILSLVPSVDSHKSCIFTGHR